MYKCHLQTINHFFCHLTNTHFFFFLFKYFVIYQVMTINETFLSPLVV